MKAGMNYPERYRWMQNAWRENGVSIRAKMSGSEHSSIPGSNSVDWILRDLNRGANAVEGDLANWVGTVGAS